MSAQILEFSGTVIKSTHILEIFGIDNEDLQAEFAEFKGKVQSPTGTTRCLVKSMLKPVHVLGNI